MDAHDSVDRRGRVGRDGAAGGAAAVARHGFTAGSVTRLDLDLPAGVELVTVYPPAVVLSPDGTRVAFVGVFRGLRQLYTRRLDQFETVPIRGTENANAVFMSPDGRALGFITADLALKKVSLADGLVTTVEHDAEFSTGAAWGADDRITFVRAGALWQVPASGGPAKQLTTLDSGKRELLHAWPSVIAERRILLFVSITGSSRGASHIEALSLPTGQRRVIVESGTFPLYAAERSSGVLPRRRTARRRLRCRPAGVDGASRSRPRKPRCGYDHGRTVGGAVQCWFIDVRTERRGDHTTRVGVSSRSGTADHRNPAAISVPPAGAGRPADGCGHGWRPVDSGHRACDLYAADLLNRRSAMPFPSGRQMARVCCSGHRPECIGSPATAAVILKRLPAAFPEIFRVLFHLTATRSPSCAKTLRPPAMCTSSRSAVGLASDRW